MRLGITSSQSLQSLCTESSVADVDHSRVATDEATVSYLGTADLACLFRGTKRTSAWFTPERQYARYFVGQWTSRSGDCVYISPEVVRAVGLNPRVLQHHTA